MYVTSGALAAKTYQYRMSEGEAKAPWEAVQALRGKFKGS